MENDLDNTESYNHITSSPLKCISEFEKLLYEKEQYYTFYGKFLTLQNNFNKSMCDTIYVKDSEYIYRKWTRSKNCVVTFIAFLNESNKEKLFKWLQMSEITK